MLKSRYKRKYTPEDLALSFSKWSNLLPRALPVVPYPNRHISADRGEFASVVEARFDQFSSYSLDSLKYLIRRSFVTLNNQRNYFKGLSMKKIFWEINNNIKIIHAHSVEPFVGTFEVVEQYDGIIFLFSALFAFFRIFYFFLRRS